MKKLEITFTEKNSRLEINTRNYGFEYSECIGLLEIAKQEYINNINTISTIEGEEEMTPCPSALDSIF